ncbi:MAG: DUF805 domain-containing protein [Alphaproteobacteria bacterium]|nr:DUF805 domain-containing protein [Alphaproteobacteria bacterium]
MAWRMGRAAFWRFLVINLLVVAAIVLLLPKDLDLPLKDGDSVPLPPVPIKPIIALLLCLPSGWMGRRRLHDAGKGGWHTWIPFLAFACFATAQAIAAPMMLKYAFWAQAHGESATSVQAGMVGIFALWLCGLLLAAGTLRTVFLWLQPGDVQDNRYGPAPASTQQWGTAPVIAMLPKVGRLGRLPFWIIVVVNYLAFRLLNDQVHIPMELVILLYLPSFAAAVPRLHDTGRTAAPAAAAFAIGAIDPFLEGPLKHWALMAFAPDGLLGSFFAGNATVIVANIATFYLLFLCWQPGEPGSNQYGQGPAEAAIDDFVTQSASPQAPARPTAQTYVAKPVTRGAAQRSFGKRAN